MLGVVTSFSQPMKRSLRFCHFEVDLLSLDRSSARVLLEELLDRLSDEGNKVRSSSLLLLPVSRSSSSESAVYLRCCHGSGRLEDSGDRARTARLLLRLTMVPKASKLTTISGSNTAPSAIFVRSESGVQAVVGLTSEDRQDYDEMERTGMRLI